MCESENEDIAIAIVAVGSALLKRKTEKLKKARRLWSHKLWLQRYKYGAGYRLIESICENNSDKFTNFVRMTPHQFEYILERVGPLIAKNDTFWRKAISPKIRLAITLRYLATGETQSSQQFNFHVAQNTISGIIHETSIAIHNVFKDEYLKFPAERSNWQSIGDEFQRLWQFPNCLGAIDGKHFLIKPPPNSGSLYYNYKNQNSIVLMAIVDANYKFLFTDVGINGRMSDSGIWSRSILRKKIEENCLNIPGPAQLPNSDKVTEFCFVADDAFPLTTYMQKPFAKSYLDEEEDIFNKRLSRARRVVENAFGILVNRFQVFQKAINLHPTKATNIINAALVLHNYLRTEKIRSTMIEETDLDNIRCAATHFASYRGREADDGKIMRNILKNYFVNEGKLNFFS